MIYRIFIIIFITTIVAGQVFSQESRNCLLQGKITDLMRRPLPGSIIQVEDQNKAVFSSVSTVEGDYQIQGFICGKVNVTYTQRNFHVAHMSMNLADSTSKTFNVGLTVGWITTIPLLRIKGKIVDDKGRKISGAKINVTAVLNETVGNSETSDSRGLFELIVNDFGEYNVEITAKDKKARSYAVGRDE